VVQVHGYELSTADRAIGALGGIRSWLPNPYLLIQPFLRREAVLSSQIEGTQASLSDLAIFEAAATPPREGYRGTSERSRTT
jgi:Fic family protein